jgi:hypothetical protein
VTYDNATRKTAVRLLHAGHTYPAVQEITGAPIRTLTRWARAAGVPLRQDNRLTTPEVMRLSVKFGTRGAAEVLGCSRGSVGYHRAKARRQDAGTNT